MLFEIVPIVCNDYQPIEPCYMSIGIDKSYNQTEMLTTFIVVDHNQIILSSNSIKSSKNHSYLFEVNKKIEAIRKKYNCRIIYDERYVFQ